MGREKKKIDWVRVEDLLKAQCSAAVISRVLGLKTVTLRRRCEIDMKLSWTEFAQLKQEEGVALVKESMFKDALAGAHNGGPDR
jgi:hypothetical protein